MPIKATINRDWISSIWKTVEAGQPIDWADFEWYALDRDGLIGMLTSAGPGPVPTSVFRDLDAYINAREYFGRLPQKGPADILIKKPRVDDWRLAAERGLFGFDYLFATEPVQVRYCLIARPQQPLHTEDIPNWLRDWLEPVTLKQAVFRECTSTGVDLAGSGVAWL